MDPNTALAELRALLKAYIAGDDSRNTLFDIAERTAALDAWIAGGGFLPDAWQR